MNHEATHLFKLFSVARRRFTEQADIITILVTVALSAIIYGWIEGTLYPYYPNKQEFSILGHFTWYHVAFFSLFFMIAFSISLSRVVMRGRHVYYLILASIGSVAWGFWIEDMSYFATLYPTSLLQPGVWVEWGMGGVHVLNQWVPWVYVLLCSGGFFLFGWAYLVGKRDIVTFALLAPQKPPSRLKRGILHALIITLFALFVESSNLIAADLRSINMVMTVLERLGSIACVVIVIPIMILLAMDHLYSAVR